MKVSYLFVFPPLFLILNAQDLCPNPEDITPCICITIEDRPSLDCVEIDDEDQLEEIFMADFPESSIELFQLRNSSITEITRNIFGNFTFEQVYITTDYMNAISEDAFENSEETLLNMEVNNCPITSSSFPFANLESYTSLIQLKFSFNLLTEFPIIVSNSLTALFIHYNELITEIPSEAIANTPQLAKLDLQGCGISTANTDAFQNADQLEYLSFKYNSMSAVTRPLFRNLPNLELLDLSDNAISDMDIDTFADLPALLRLELLSNHLPPIQSTTFENNPLLDYLDLSFNDFLSIEPGTFSKNTLLTFLDVGSNNITSLETGTFDGLNITELSLQFNSIDFIDQNAFGDITSSFIDLGYNELTELSEYWLRPLLDAGNYITVSENPFDCGCEVEWIIDDPTYVQRVFGTCPDGISIWYLNETSFEDC